MAQAQLLEYSKGKTNRCCAVGRQKEGSSGDVWLRLAVFKIQTKRERKRGERGDAVPLVLGLERDGEKDNGKAEAMGREN